MVLQRNVLKVARKKRFVVKIIRIISHSGTHSHSSMVVGGVSSNVHRVSRGYWKDIHPYGAFKIFHQTIGHIKPNSSTFASVTLVCQLDNFWKCQAAIYQEKDHTWNNVVINTVLRIEVTDFLAIIKMEENDISLNGKVTCPFIPGYCFVAVMGEIFWHTTSTDKCERQFSIFLKLKLKF